jgi:hypothetical protein
MEERRDEGSNCLTVLKNLRQPLPVLEDVCCNVAVGDIDPFHLPCGTGTKADKGQITHSETWVWLQCVETVRGGGNYLAEIERFPGLALRGVA